MIRLNAASDKRNTDTNFHIRRIRENPELSNEERERQEGEVREIIEFVNNETDCRRKQLLRRFDEEFDPANCHKTCDNCATLDGAVVLDQDVTEAARQLVAMMQAAKAIAPKGELRMARGAITAAFVGRAPREIRDKGLDKLPQFAYGKEANVNIGLAERIFDQLVTDRVFETIVWYPNAKSHPVTSYQVNSPAPPLS